MLVKIINQATMTYSKRFKEFSQIKFEFIKNTFIWLKYNLFYFAYYCISAVKRSEFHNYFNAATDVNTINHNNSTQPKNKKCVSISDDNAIVLKWNEKMFQTFETDIELRILPENSWVLDLSYDEGNFTKYCAKKYPELNFVFFANKTSTYEELNNTLPKNAHVFFVTPNHFVNQNNVAYEDFALNNKIGYRRIFASQGTEYWTNYPAIFERVDKCLFKDYGNTIKSYLLLYKISHSYETRYTPKPTPNFVTNPIDFLGLFNNHLNQVSRREIHCHFENAIEHLPFSPPHAVLSAFYKNHAIFISKHVFHPVSDFNNN
jgi:hypothetical protein